MDLKIDTVKCFTKEEKHNWALRKHLLTPSNYSEQALLSRQRDPLFERTVISRDERKVISEDIIMAKVVNKSSSSSRRRKQQYKKSRIKHQNNPATKLSNNNELSPSNQFGNYRTVSISLSVILFLAGILLIAVPFFVSSNGVPGNEHRDFFVSKEMSHHTNILWPCFPTFNTVITTKICIL